MVQRVLDFHLHTVVFRTPWTRKGKHIIGMTSYRESSWVGPETRYEGDADTVAREEYRRLMEPWNLYVYIGRYIGTDPAMLPPLSPPFYTGL